MVKIVFQNELLRARRKAKGLTQEQLAEYCGCSPRYLRTLETGAKSNPSAVLVRKIAMVLNVSMEELLTCEREDDEWFPHFPSALPY